jgi:nucleotide-binding universal stress UspA family protein
VTEGAERPGARKGSVAQIRRILVGIDFSAASQRALDVAIELAKRSGASLLLLHVYQVPGFAFPETVVPAPPDLLDRMVDDNRRALEAWADRARAAGVDAAADQVAGAAATEIVERARRGFDLVVVGTHGRTGLRHVLLGSVAERVVRHCDVPVLSVRTRGGAAVEEHAP